MSESRLHLTHFNQDHPKLGRFLVASLVVHALTFALLAGGWFGSAHRAKPPVYFVDLVHKPVLNPQAGRPDPRPKVKPQPKTAPVKTAAPEPVKPKPEAVKIKPQPKPKPVKPKSEAVKVKPQPKPQPDVSAEQKRLAAIEELRQKQAHQSDIEALKQRLAKLQQAPSAATVPQDVPVGMPEGTGNEVGVSVLAHIQGYIQQNWALSPYLLDRSRIGTIEAKVLLAYSADGILTRFRIVESSGDDQFDESIKRAIIKSKKLEQKLPKNTEMTVVFNLKEMAATRR